MLKVRHLVLGSCLELTTLMGLPGFELRLVRYISVTVSHVGDTKNMSFVVRMLSLSWRT